MGNGNPSAGAVERARAATGKGNNGDDGTAGLNVPRFDADARAQLREGAIVTIGGKQFRRKKKVLKVSRALRRLIREQETHIAKGNRISARLGEVEVDQLEAATAGEEEKVAKLEEAIGALVREGDAAREESELVSLRIIELLLLPDGGTEEAPAEWPVAPELDEDGEPNGPETPVGFLQGELDVEDATAIANLLANGREPDPQMTQGSDDT